MALHGGVKLVALLIVVAVDAAKRYPQAGKNIQGFGLGDVAGVDDVLDAMGVEQLDDPADVLQIVVGVADDADLHHKKGRQLPGAPFAGSGSLDFL